MAGSSFLALLLLAAGLYWSLTGAPFDRATYDLLAGGSWVTSLDAQPPATARVFATLFRLLGGNTAILAGGLMLAIAITSYRSGQICAWIAVWLLPLHSVLDLLLVWSAGALTPGALGWDVLLVSLTVSAQLVTRPHRRLTRA